MRLSGCVPKKYEEIEVLRADIMTSVFMTKKEILDSRILLRTIENMPIEVRVGDLIKILK